MLNRLKFVFVPIFFLFSSAMAAAQSQSQTLTTNWVCTPSTSGANSVLSCTPSGPIVIQWPTAANLAASSAPAGSTLTLAAADTSAFVCNPSSAVSPTASNLYALTANCSNIPAGAASPTYSWAVSGSAANGTSANASGDGAAVTVPPQLNSVTYNLTACVANNCAPTASVSVTNISAPTGCGISATSGGLALQSGASLAAGVGASLSVTCSSGTLAPNRTIAWSANPSASISSGSPVSVTPFTIGSTNTTVTYSVNVCNGTSTSSCTTVSGFQINRQSTPPLGGAIDASACGSSTTYYAWPSGSTAYSYSTQVDPSISHVVYVDIPAGRRLTYAMASGWTNVDITVSKTFACRYGSLFEGVTVPLVNGNTMNYRHSSTPVATNPYNAYAVDVNRWAISIRGLSNGQTNIGFTLQ